MLSLIVLILEITVLAIIKSIGVICVSNSVAILMIIAFSLSLFLSVQWGKVTYYYSNQIIAGYLIRLFLLFFDIFGTKIHVLPQSGADSSMFYRSSMEWVLYGKSGGSSGFIQFMYNLFSFIGINRLYGQFLLLLFSIAAIIIFILSVDKLSIKEEAKQRSAWIICLLPNFALLSSIFLRESIVTFLLTISICYMIAWMNGGGVLSFIVAIVFSIVACYFHSGCIGITIGCIACLLIYDNYEKRMHLTIINSIITIIIALGLSFIFLQYGESLMGKFMGVDSVADIANVSEYGGSSYTQYVGNSNNPINMILYTIPRISYFLFSPFPWQWRGISDIIAFFFSGLYYFITIINVIRYLQKGEKNNREMVICLLIVAFFCTFIFAWGVSNTGTASRHRDKMVCLYGMLYALTVHASEMRVNCIEKS